MRPLVFIYLFCLVRAMTTKLCIRITVIGLVQMDIQLDSSTALISQLNASKIRIPSRILLSISFTQNEPKNCASATGRKLSTQQIGVPTLFCCVYVHHRKHEMRIYPILSLSSTNEEIFFSTEHKHKIHMPCDRSMIEYTLSWYTCSGHIPRSTHTLSAAF